MSDECNVQVLSYEVAIFLSYMYTANKTLNYTMYTDIDNNNDNENMLF